MQRTRKKSGLETRGNGNEGGKRKNSARNSKKQKQTGLRATKQTRLKCPLNYTDNKKVVQKGEHKLCAKVHHASHSPTRTWVLLHAAENSISCSAAQVPCYLFVFPFFLFRVAYNLHLVCASSNPVWRVVSYRQRNSHLRFHFWLRPDQSRKLWKTKDSAILV